MDASTLLAMVPAHYLPYATAAVAVCAAVATVLPAPAAKGTVYAAIYDGVNFIALNFGHAKNAGAVTTQGVTQ